MKTKLSWHFYAVCAVVAAAAIAVCIYFNLMEESAYETADLQAMRDAEAAAMLLWREKLPEEPIEYWYKPQDMKLISVSESMPAPYGMGTERRSGAVKSFVNETGKAFDYSSVEGYTDKVLHVIVSSKDEVLDIRVDWVQCE